MKPLTEILFYDGHCGLCHRAVQFVVRHDRKGALFRFAPLQGRTFEAVRAEQLPDSMVVQTADGRLLFKSDAWIHILRRLGVGWNTMATLCAVFPRTLRDWVYDLVAAVRVHVWGRRDELCPIVPPELRGRFLP